jgi:hypothetical protein
MFSVIRRAEPAIGKSALWPENGGVSGVARRIGVSAG